MSMTNCAISVIVPIYKVEPYIRQCVDSLVNQTHKDFEIILVDDGSPDNCPEICDEYAAKDSRVKVIHKKNGGLVSARKAGLVCSTGEYVTFVDGDYWVDEDYLEQINDIIERFKLDVVSVTAFYSAVDNKSEHTSVGDQYNGIYDKSKLISDFYPYIFSYSPDFKFGMAPSLWNKFIKREILYEVLPNVPDNIRMGEDLAVTLPCILKAHSVYFSNICGYYYRQNPASITNTFDTSAPERVCSLLKTLREEISQYTVNNIEDQIAFYAVFIAEFTLISLIKGSYDIRKDLKHFNVLWNDSALQVGIRKKLPIKTKIILLLAKLRQVWLIKLIRQLKYGKEANCV